MNKKFLLSAVSVILICVVVWTVYSQKTPSSNQTWEYLVIEDPSSKYGILKVKPELDKLGEQGWELVGVSNKVSGNGDSNNTQTDFIFKRAK